MIKGRTANARERATLRAVLPLVAVGSGLAAAPAGALELGELTVESNLGQPLRASIAYALAPNEALSKSCVSVSGIHAAGGLPGIGKNTVSITKRTIVITGDRAIREPMLGTRITIDCPYAANLSREYMLFVDPAGVVEKQAAATTAASLPATRPQTEPRAIDRPAAATPSRSADAPIGQVTRYRVQPGDTLYRIVSRIENRSMALWPAVNRVFAANPAAFINNDPDKLKAGSWLTIPGLDGTATVETYEPAAFDEPVEAPAEVPVEAPAEIPTETVATVDDTTDLQPIDAGLDDIPVTQAEVVDTAVTPTEVIDIPDTRLEGPQTTSASPNVPTAIIRTGARNESTSTLMWLASAGLGIIGALLLLGRRFRGRTVSKPETPSTPDASDPFADYDIADDSPTQESLILDADLGLGTGLKDTGEIDVAEDFGFETATEVDIELPFEPTAAEPGEETDIIPPIDRDTESILDHEVMPEEDDYDMSIIKDATMMPLPEDVTERDLMAVEVDASGNIDFTIDEETNYDLLEQDYEEELSATQMLNIEIERAAAALANDLDEAVADDDTAAVAAKEAIAEFEASCNIDDTNAVTVNLSREDETAELSVANDDSSEMDPAANKSAGNS